MKTRVRILLRQYLKPFMWEDLDAYEARINEFVESHDVVELAPIGMDGVMIRYVDKPHHEMAMAHFGAKPFSYNQVKEKTIVPDHSTGPTVGLKIAEPIKCKHDWVRSEYAHEKRCSKCGIWWSSGDPEPS